MSEICGVNPHFLWVQFSQLIMWRVGLALTSVVHSLEHSSVWYPVCNIVQFIIFSISSILMWLKFIRIIGVLDSGFQTQTVLLGWFNIFFWHPHFNLSGCPNFFSSNVWKTSCLSFSPPYFPAYKWNEAVTLRVNDNRM